MRFVAIEHLQMKVAPRLVGERLEELASQTETERAGHVLALFRPAEGLVRKPAQAAPDQMRPAAEVNHAARQALVHRNVGFSGERVLRVKPGAITANACLVSKGPREGLAQNDAAILD